MPAVIISSQILLQPITTLESLTRYIIRNILFFLLKKIEKITQFIRSINCHFVTWPLSQFSNIIIYKINNNKFNTCIYFYILFFIYREFALFTNHTVWRTELEGREYLKVIFFFFFLPNTGRRVNTTIFLFYAFVLPVLLNRLKKKSCNHNSKLKKNQIKFNRAA